jgi:hypothetical protein
MEADIGRGLVSLRERGPGHAVIGALLSQPGLLRSRGRLARLWGVSPLSEQGRAWYHGALGEIAVGRMLSKLGSSWVVLHAVPLGRRGSDIDHLVVGASGVFTVNTKNHSGQRVWVMDRVFMVAGQRCDHIRNSEFEASRVARLLGEVLGWPVPVRAVLAVLDPALLQIKRRPAGVEVLEARKLVRWLKKRGRVLSAEQLAQIDSVVGVAATWEQQPDHAADLDRRNDFDSLQREIKQARRRRLTWLVGVFAIGLLAAGLALT